jgi:hypothetical protein
VPTVAVEEGQYTARAFKHTPLEHKDEQHCELEVHEFPVGVQASQ